MNKYLLHDNINAYESNILEYKFTFDKTNTEKYIKTICAFLNTKGGTLIFGIRDDGYIQGCKDKRDLIDSVKLFIDNLRNLIFKTNGELLDLENVKIQHYCIAYNTYIIEIICAEPEEKNQYQYKNDIYERLNASTIKRKTDRLYTKQDYDQLNNRVNKLNKSHQKLKEEHKLLEYDFNNLQKKYHAKRHENSELSKKLDDLQNKYDALTNKNFKLTEEKINTETISNIYYLPNANSFSKFIVDLFN